jgi:hypothetical protein
MVNVNDVYGGKYLNAKKVTSEKLWRKPLTISLVELEEFKKLNEDTDETEDKLVVSFKETEYGLILNKTNANTLAEMYGDESDDWIGHKVSFQKVKTSMGDSVQIDDTFEE